MGEAKRRDEATAAAMGANVQVAKLSVMAGVVAMQLDLACHCLDGIKYMLEKNLGVAEAGAEIEKSIQHLQAYKTRFIAAQASKVVLARPEDVPRVAL